MNGYISTAEIMIGSSGLSPRYAMAFVRLRAHIDLWGSVSLRFAHELAECGARFFQEKVWPRLSDRFLVHDGRLVGTVVETPTTPAFSKPDVPLTARQRSAAYAASVRWGAATVVERADADAHETRDSHRDTHASAYAEGDAEHAVEHAVEHAQRIDSRARVRDTHSLPDSDSCSDSESSPGERGGSGGRADSLATGNENPAAGMRTRNENPAPDMRTRNESMRKSSDFNVPSRAIDSKIASKSSLPADWHMSPQDRVVVAKYGYPGELADRCAAAFTEVYRASGEPFANWSAKFQQFCREGVRGVARAQTSMTLAIPGGETAAKPAESADDRALKTRVHACVLMRDRAPSMAVPPTFETLKKAGALGLEWLAAMEAWAARGFRGDRPPEFRTFLAEAAAARASEAAVRQSSG